MKKLLIVINNLEIGGVQISLLNLLDEICNEYDVTVLPLFFRPEYTELLPNGVKLIKTKSPFKYFGMPNYCAFGRPLRLAARSFWAAIARTLSRAFTVKIMSLFTRKIKGYDVAVSYLHEGQRRSFYGGCNDFVLKKVVADKKLTWIHCDFSLCGANNDVSKGIYKRFDGIVACSYGAAETFCGCVPELADKCVVIRNCNNYEKIRSQSKDAIQYDREYFNVVTVARLSREKGIERALAAVKYCVENGVKIKYHIVGSGACEGELKALVEALSLGDTVKFYGSQKNPYVYMPNADLFLLSSYHEAAPMVFDEAACLGLPVLATKTTSTAEMITDCGHGFVCENTQEAIKEALYDICKNRHKLDDIRDTLSKEAFNNEHSIQALRGLIS